MVHEVVYPQESFNQKYTITDEGEVFSPYRGGRIISPQEIAKGYLRVGLMTSSGRKFFMVHRLVLEAFNPIQGSLSMQVNHKDGNKHNNKLSNLEWCDGFYNIKHAWETGLRKWHGGEEIGGHKLTEEEVLDIIHLLKEGQMSGAEIGRKYNVSRYCISDIKRGRSWSWLTSTYLKGSTTMEKSSRTEA